MTEKVCEGLGRKLVCTQRYDQGDAQSILHCVCHFCVCIRNSLNILN